MENKGTCLSTEYSTAQSQNNIVATLFLIFLFFQQGFTKDTDQQQSANIHQTRQNVSKQIPLQHPVASLTAFSADLPTSKELRDDVIIVFNRVLANEGGLYNRDSGEFQCEDDAVHIFLWSIRKSNVPDAEGMRCIAKLQTDGTDLKFGPKTNYYSTISSGAAEMISVTQCTPSTAISIMTVPWSEVIGTRSVFHADQTMFSGFKLQEQTAFTIELSSDVYLFPNSRIQFDQVLSNIGRHYDVVNNRFKCPDEGIYVFSVFIHTTDPSTPWSVVRLMMENEVVVQGPITYAATNDYDSGTASVTAVVQCGQDTSVYVEAQNAHDFPYNSYSSKLTSFTGFKLYNATEGAVAFTTVMSNNQSIISENQTFTLDNIITNIGNAYNGNLSQFVCPDDNYYLFTWAGTANYGGGHIDLYMDDTLVKRLPLTRQLNSDSSGTSGTSSISVMKQCETGSIVKLVGQDVDSSRVYLAGYVYFSGYKIPGQWAIDT